MNGYFKRLRISIISLYAKHESEHKFAQCQFLQFSVSRNQITWPSCFTSNLCHQPISSLQFPQRRSARDPDWRTPGRSSTLAEQRKCHKLFFCIAHTPMHRRPRIQSQALRRPSCPRRPRSEKWPSITVHSSPHMSVSRPLARRHWRVCKPCATVVAQVERTSDWTQQDWID